MSQCHRHFSSYVWNEPPGRMKKILELLRFSEQRWKYIRKQHMEKVIETTRRVRMSNCAFQPRLEDLEQQYEHLSYGLRDLVAALTKLCTHHGVAPPVHKRRKFNFDHITAYTVGGKKYDPSASSRKSSAVQPKFPVKNDAPLLRPEVYSAAARPKEE